MSAKRNRETVPFKEANHVGRVAEAPKPSKSVRERARLAWKVAKVAGAVLAVAELAHIAGDFGFNLPGFSGSTEGTASSAMNLESYSVQYVPKDCSSEVTALAGTKVNAHYHLPIIHTQSGSANIDKSLPLQWGECNIFTGTKTPAVFGRVNGKVVSVIAPVPVPSATNLGVADLNLDVCLPLKSDATKSEEESLRAKYIADAKAHHVDPCELESHVSGFVINDATSADAQELSRQLADLAGYTQPVPLQAERQIMRDAQRAMIAQEKQDYPGAKISAPMSPIESPYQQTLQGWETVMNHTDAEYMFSNIHFSSEHGQTILSIGANSVNGTVELANDPLTHAQQHHLNSLVPQF